VKSVRTSRRSAEISPGEARIIDEIRRPVWILNRHTTLPMWSRDGMTMRYVMMLAKLDEQKKAEAK
jgi:hypothetical protein